MNIDELFKMTSSELDEYLEDEVSKVIDAAPEDKRDILRATHNRARMQVKAAKNPIDAMLRTNEIMMFEFRKLRQMLNDLSNL